MNNFKQLHWPLIFGLAGLAFVIPLLNVTGIMDRIGRPLGPLVALTLISLVWLVTVVMLRVRQPVLTLVCTGIVNGLFAFTVSMIFAPLVAGEWIRPLTNPFVLPFAFSGIMLTNTLWGLTVGLIAWAVQQAGGTANGQASRS